MKLGVADHIRQYLNVNLPVMHANHHQSHAASAFYPSPFEQAAILTVDGVGEWATTCIGAGRGPAIELTAEIRWPHSIGLLYSAFTSYCGFEPNSDEYKLMGLAGYGKPVYAQVIRERVVAALPDGAFRVTGDMFGWSDGGAATSPRLHEMLGPPRQSCEELTERYADVAASVQAVVEELIVALASEACRRAKSRNLVMAGGVALNCLANARVLESVVDQLWAQPAAGDAGGSLGAALLASHKAFGVQRRPASPDGQGGSLLGPAWSTDEVRAFLTWQGAPHELVPDQATLVERVAAALEDGKVVGWFQGPMEFGPRALGGRSILADARRPEARELLNKVVKRREPFRPFAPSVLAERAAELFEISAPSPYMLLTANVRKGAGLPATTHVDGTARVQTVDATTNPRFRGAHRGLLRPDRLPGHPEHVLQRRR